MVREYYSLQSAVVLNMSQEYRSSPSPTPISEMDHQEASFSANALNDREESLQVQETIELVEDSCKEYHVGKGSAARDVPLEIEGDAMEDEGSAGPNPRERESEVADPYTRRWSAAEPPAQSSLHGAQEDSQASKGATSSKSVGKRSQHSEAKTHVKSFDATNTPSGPTKSNKASKPERKGAPSPAKPQGRLPRVAKQTALDALYTMHDKHSDHAQASEESMGQMSYKAQVSHPKLPIGEDAPARKTAPQLQTPLTVSASRQSQGQRTSKGKLPTQKPPVKTSMSGSLVPKPKATSNKRVAPDKSDDEYQDTQCPVTRRASAIEPPIKEARMTNGPHMGAALEQGGGTSQPTTARFSGTLKRPPTAAGSAKLPTKFESVYDFPDESDRQPPAKKRRGTSQVLKPAVAKPRAGGRMRQLMQVHQDEQSNTTAAVKEVKRPKGSLEETRVESQPSDFAAAVGKQKEHHMTSSKTSRPSDQSSENPRLRRSGSATPHEGDRSNKLPLQKIDPGLLLSKPRPFTQNAAPIFSNTVIAEGSSNRQGNSQANAIDIPEDVETSSPEAPEVPVSSHQQLIQRKDQDRETVKQRLTTPANLGSSPPEVGRRSGLVPDATKQSVIGWGKNGPLNQGSSRRLRPVLGSARWDRSWALPDQMATSGSRQKVRTRMLETEEQAGAGSRHAESATSLGNVASKAEDAFSTFRGQTASRPWPGSAKVSVRTVQKISGKPLAVESGKKGARPGSTLSFQHSPAKTQASLIVSRHHQDHEPLPADDEDEFPRPLDDFEGSTLVDEEAQPGEDFSVPTASQKEMPPPPGKGKNIVRSRTGPIVPSMTASARSDGVATAESSPQPAGHKRKREAVPERIQDHTKRASMEQGPPAVGRPDAEVHGSSGKLVAQPSPPPQKSKSLIARPSKAARTSSQTVDVTGSPIQKGVDVPALTTALEHYAQDTLSPSRSEAAYTEAPSSQRKSRKPATSFLRLARPLTQNPRDSCSVRIPTAAFRMESPTPSMKASGAAVEELMRLEQMREPPTDPFTSSRDSVAPLHVEKNQSASMKAVRRRDMGVSLPSADAEAMDEDEDGQSEVEQDGEDEGDVGKENGDPDKTLVEPETSHQRPSKSVLSKSPDESPRSNKVVDPVEEEDNELGIWRKALKPHQMTLFDSLVIVSHKLVQGLVDQETAMSDMIEDYRTKGESIVIQLENAKAKAYHDHLRSMHQRNLDLADKLVKGDQKLQEISTREKTELRRGPRLADSLHTINDRLERMMESLG